MPTELRTRPTDLSYKGLTAPASATPAKAVKVSPEGVVTAIVGVTGVVDEVDDLIVPGAFTATLHKRNPKVVDDHEWKNKVGRTLHVEEWPPGDPRLPKHTKEGKPWPKEAGALVATLQYNLRAQRGAEAFEWVRFYAESNEAEFSIGYKATRARKRSDGVRVILALDLFEFSHVLFGAAPLSMALEVKSQPGVSAGTVTVPAMTGAEDDSTDYAEVDVPPSAGPWDEEAPVRAPVESKTAASVLLAAQDRLEAFMEVKRGDAETLRRYWTHGEGAAKIGWGTPGDFDRCVKELMDDGHMTAEQAKGYCNLRHHEALGFYPATHAKMEGKTVPETHETKARGRMKGSYEERIALLEEAAADVMTALLGADDGETDDVMVSTVATYADEAVFSVWVNGDQSNYLIPYTVADPDEDGDTDGIALGEPQQVELSLVVESDDDSAPEEVPFDAEQFGKLVAATFDAAQAANADPALAVEGKSAETPDGAPAGDSEQHQADADTITKDNLPEGVQWGEYRKTAPIKAYRVDGPFKVETREGVVECSDGWLALDDGGFPYPIAADEFDNIYAPADSAATGDGDGADAENAADAGTDQGTDATTGDPARMTPDDEAAAVADPPATDAPADGDGPDAENSADAATDATADGGDTVKLNPDEHFKTMDELNAALDNSASPDAA